MQTQVFDKTETQGFRELLQKYQSKSDYALPANLIHMRDDGSVEAREYVTLGTEPVSFEAIPTDWAMHQIAEYIGMHWSYAKKLIQYPAMPLMAQNVNYWFSRNTEDRRLVRIFEGELIGFLSDMYRSIDNYDIFTWTQGTAAKIAAESGFELQLVRPYLSETRMNATILSSEFIQLEPGNDKDVYRMGINLRNSEVGNGSFSIRPMLLRTSCQNSNIFAGHDDFIYKRIHRGSRIGIGQVQWSTDTQRLQAGTIRAEIVDVVKAAFNKDLAMERVNMLRKLKDVPFTPSPARVKATINVLGLGEKESDEIWAKLERNTRYEFLQAITNHAQTYYRKGADVERGTELEELGGHLIMHQDVWDQIDRQTKKEEDKSSSNNSQEA